MAITRTELKITSFTKGSIVLASITTAPLETVVTLYFQGEPTSTGGDKPVMVQAPMLQQRFTFSAPPERTKMNSLNAAQIGALAGTTLLGFLKNPSCIEGRKILFAAESKVVPEEGKRAFFNYRILPAQSSTEDSAIARTLALPGVLA